MSDPADIPGRHKPRRAEPLQPDRPGRGDGPLKPDDPAADRAAAQHDETKSKDGLSQPARQQKHQSEDALDNVRDGYN